MHPILNIAIQAIRPAGTFLVKQYEFFNSKNIQKDYTYNIITEINKKANRIITKIINKFYPQHTIVTAYDNNIIYLYKSYTNNPCWIINPIDNNLNYYKQFPFFSLSIAVQIKKNIEIGVIYDPIHNELFSSCRGHGAQLNGYRIRVNTTKNLSNSIIATMYFNQEHTIMTNLFQKLKTQYVNFRCTGTISLDLAYISVGRIDGYVGLLEKPFDICLASNILLLQETGGLVADFNGSSINNTSNNIIAGNPKIFKKILSIIH